MREKLLCMTFELYYAAIGDMCVWVAQKTVDARKRIYFEVTGEEIL